MHGFPAVLTSFIGRDGLVHEVAGLLEECRLVTVTGPGGAGKTRLGIAATTQLVEAFAYLGLTVFTGYFLNYAQTDSDV